MIDDVLDELRAVGAVDSEGEFTLDRARAREKLQRFRLADPRAYVLELVQAAALAGATAVRFSIDAQNMVMTLDGRPFTPADFDGLYEAALSRRNDRAVLARRQLAIGLGSAMALRPRFIEVESGDGKAGARLRMRPDADDVFEAIETTWVGTRIHVYERFTLGTFSAFFRNLAGRLAEEQLLRRRCSYASFCIDLEGKRIDQGLGLHDEPVLEAVEVRGEHVEGSCGLRKDGRGPPQVRIVKDGVWIVDHELPRERFPAAFRALVQGHALRKDVSQSDIVRDEAYDAMLVELARASWRALARLAARVTEGSALRWAEAVLLRQLDEVVRLRLVHALDEPTGLVRTLRRVPLWSTLGARVPSLDEILAEAAASGEVGYTSTAGFEGVALPGRPFVLVLPEPEASADGGQAMLFRRILEHVLGTSLRDVTEALAAARRREQARRAWRLRPADHVLPAGAYLCRRPFVAPGVKGELGLAAAQTDHATVAWVVDGALLTEQEIALPWLGLRIVVAAEGVRADESFERVEPTVEACAALLHAVVGVPALYAELAHAAVDDAWAAACARSFLESALRRDSLELVLEHLAPSLEVHHTALAAFDGVTLGLDVGLRGEAPHPTVDLPLWRTVGGPRLSLRELVERSRHGEELLAVEEAPPDLEANVLVLDAEERALLQPWLCGPIGDGTAAIDRRLRQREFLGKPAGPPALDGTPPAVLVPIEGEGITGVLRLWPKGGMGRRSIAVLHQQRAIDSLPLWMAGDCEGWVESTALAPTSGFGGVHDDEALDRVRAAVLRAFATACLRVAERSRVDATADDTAFLGVVLGLAFPGALRAAYDNLRQVGVTPQQAAELHARLYAELHLPRMPGAFEHRMERLARSKTPAADVLAMAEPSPRVRTWVLAAVDVLFPPGADPRDLPARVLRPAAPLPELPLFRRYGGRPLALAAIREVVEREQPVLHTYERTDLDLADHLVVLVDDAQLETLRGVVGPRLLRPGDDVIAQARRRRVLEGRAKVERVALAPGDALVSVRLDRKRGALAGEVGLLARHPGDPGRSPRVRIATHVERAPIEEVELPERRAWLVAVVDDDRLRIASDRTGVERNEAFDAIVARCESRWPKLVRRLLSAWDELPTASRPAAWYHVLDFLVEHRPALVGEWTRAEAIHDPLDETIAKAATRPGFVAIGGGPCSLLTLVRAHQRHRRIDVLPAASQGPWGESPLPDDRPVVCVDAYELAALRRLLPRVERVEGAWAQWQARARQGNAALVARMLPDDAVLVSHEVTTAPVQGRLAIPRPGHPLTIDLCADGLVIAAQGLPGVLPCWGSVAGAGVRPDPRWTSAVVDGLALPALQAASHALYEALARWLTVYEHDPAHAYAASLLAEPVVALRRAERAGPLAGSAARLLAALRSARVLPLPNGRRISLHTALQEQPDALAHLDLWDAPAHRLQRMYADAAASSAVVAPARPAPAPDPEAALLEALRAELRLVRARSERLLDAAHLDRIHVGSLGGEGPPVRAESRGIVVDREHPVVRRAVAELPTDPVWASYVASAIYTALNVRLSEITDADERTFLPLHADLVAGR